MGAEPEFFLHLHSLQCIVKFSLAVVDLIGPLKFVIVSLSIAVYAPIVILGHTGVMSSALCRDSTRTRINRKFQYATTCDQEYIFLNC